MITVNFYYKNLNFGCGHLWRVQNFLGYPYSNWNQHAHTLVYILLPCNSIWQCRRGVQYIVDHGKFAVIFIPTGSLVQQHKADIVLFQITTL